jgi:C-5 cytosine-specific DNA methylase
MKAYYNEIDEYAAQWLRNLIAAGHITPGDVDTRSIEDVAPDDLKGYTRAHFFAGVGVWDYALNRAGWGTGEVWTGSCPCQPFSVAGKGDGFSDERHLWPAFFHLIEECRPVTVFGEQVASKDGYAWLDLVQADLEGSSYTVGSLVAPAAGFGAPHQRHRMYWVADADDEGSQGREFRGDRTAERVTGSRGLAGGLADTLPTGRTEGRTGAGSGQATGVRGISGLADTGNERLDGEYPLLQRQESGRFAPDSVEIAGNSATRGFWSAADWIYCRDEKYRPVEPIVKQMADGSTASLGRVCPSTVQEIEKEIAHAIRHQADPGKTLFNLQQAVQQDAIQRGAGRLQGVHESPVLLAFLRQLSDEGWAFSESFSRPSPQTKEITLRILRDCSPVACPPHQRGLDEQFSGESTDVMRVLSSILARYAQAAWGEAFDKNAAATRPLIVGGISRVGRLRAYGNAICAPQAEEFIKAYLETCP